MLDFYCLHNNLRGNSKRVFVPFCKSSVRKSFFTFRRFPVWNRLPACVVNSNVSIVFAQHLTSMDWSNICRL